ncbi:MAG: AEC family transporter [Sedimentibacter sp.]|uniref:AEC family transporter n=1 Tax=Sedimentibacter sp. TaxID=1960295 RepID=UPI0029825099|nr:AEC family transporter [Sedimentibacter sp.]MDW5300154.1 AEC family transporter [Sedimentibacter sp.]
MENLLFSLNVVSPIFLLMCVGAFLKKVKIFDDDFLVKANSFVFKILFPVLLFNNIYKSEIAEEVNVKLIIFAIGIVLVTIGILFIIVPKFEKDNKNRGVIIQGLYRSNFVLFGVTLCTNIFGESGLGVVTTIVAIIIPIYNFMAVIILDVYSNDKSNLKKTVISIMKNPLIIGSILGIIASALKIKLPEFMENTISDIAKVATPFALMLLGGDIEIRNIRNNLKYVTVVVIGKLLVIPALVSFVTVLFGFRGVELGAIFSMVAPSVAVTSYTMAQQYDCNYELAGQLVFVSTLVSPFSIFLFIYFFKTVGLF